MMINRGNWLKEPKPEPDKLISRNKAAMLIVNYQMGTNPYDDSDYARGYYDGLEAAFKGITENDLSPWVPVTDWLPEEGLPVVITAQEEYGRFVDTSIRSDVNYWSGFGRINVLAWMPLPEAYIGD